MRRTLPISALHGHGFVALRGYIRCSTELTRRQLVHDLGEGLEAAKVPGTEGKVHGLQDLDLPRVVFPAETGCPRIMCKEAPLSIMYVLFFDFMIGLGVDVFASSIGEWSLDELRVLHVRVSFLIFAERLWSFYAVCA